VPVNVPRNIVETSRQFNCAGYPFGVAQRLIFVVALLQRAAVAALKGHSTPY
jgi:hypothetical protein